LGIKIIQKKSSGANFIMQVSTTEPYLCNPELNRSKFISLFSKLCLQSVCNVVSIGSLFQEKFDDHPLIVLHPKRTLSRFQGTEWENNYRVNRILETDLIYLIFRRVHILEISSCEMRTRELSAGGWRMYLSTRRYPRNAKICVHSCSLQYGTNKLASPETQRTMSVQTA
jgi:hypothetical protein